MMSVACHLSSVRCPSPVCLQYLLPRRVTVLHEAINERPRGRVEDKGRRRGLWRRPNRAFNLLPLAAQAVPSS